MNFRVRSLSLISGMTRQLGMGTHDDWERLVDAVMRREQFRQLCLCDSLSSSNRSLASDSTLTTSTTWYEDGSPSLPRRTDAAKGAPATAKRGNSLWKGLQIFRGFSFKRDYGKEERDRWALDMRKLQGPPIRESITYEELNQTAEEAKRRAEIARLRELYTLKGHIEGVMKAKGIDINAFPHYYTV